MPFLNQACAGHRPVRAWFLRIASVRECLYACVCVCLRVCPPPRLLITSGVIQTPYDWLNKFYGFSLAAVVDIVSGRDVSIYTRRRIYPNKSKLALYKPLLHYNYHFKQLQLSNKTVLKVGVVYVDVRISSHLKEEQAWTVDKRLRVISTISKSTKELKELKNKAV